jgi:type VI secretion system protein ImpF
MRQPQLIEGGRALLFERLVDLDPRSQSEPLPFRIHDREALKESIRQELVRLLNTRCSVPTDRLGEEERTVLNYGIPDFSSFSPQSTDDQARLTAIIRQSVAAYEPRLSEVQVTVENFQQAQLSTHSNRAQVSEAQVTVEKFKQSTRSLWIKIEAQLITNSISEPISFPVLFSSKTGEAEVYENV